MKVIKVTIALSLVGIAIYAILSFSTDPLNRPTTPTTDPSQGSQGSQELKFNPKVVVRKAFPAIVQPESVSVEQANKSLHSKELVLGVEIDGKARAYPINMLTGPQREIINDKLGDKLIAATW